mmetsp:Transcript_10521/g.24938  ORF Transcript_10521/g.24938 Transcript_10521/m.24938 type:complete len:220 (+) Transcript_10521:323-982(+)
MAQMRRERGRFFCVLVHVRHRLGKDFAISVRTIVVVHLCRIVLIGYESVFRGRLFFFEFAISRVRLEIGNVYKVIDSSLDVGDCWLIGGESPFVVHNKFEGVLSSFQIVNIREVVTGSMHRNLTRPSVEGAGNIDLSTSVFPPKDCRYSVIVQPIFNRRTSRFHRCISIRSPYTGHGSITARSRHCFVVLLCLMWMVLLMLVLLSPDTTRSSSGPPSSG